MTNVVFDGVLSRCRELFSDKPNDRKCPECEKKSSASPKWEPWMGSLKDHLLEHYRTAYYLDMVIHTGTKYFTSRHIFRKKQMKNLIRPSIVRGPSPMKLCRAKSSNSTWTKIFFILISP